MYFLLFWKLKVPADSVSGGGQFLVHRWPSSCCTFTRQKEWGILWSFFYESTNPIHEGFTLMIWSTPKDPTSKYYSFKGIISTSEFWMGNKHSFYSTLLQKYIQSTISSPYIVSLAWISFLKYTDLILWNYS